MHLVREMHRPGLVWTTAFDPNLTVFVLPLRWHGDLAYNGALAKRSNLFRFSDPSGYFGRNSARGREVISIGIARRRLQETLAALRGVSVDDIEVGDGPLHLATASAERLRLLLSKIVADIETCPERIADAGFAARVAEAIETALVDCFLAATSANDVAARSSHSPAAVVRRAEECFMRNPSRRITLVELCKAAGVSAPTLYKAFDAVCDLTPLRYFRLRRMSLARSVLRKSPPARGRVKYAALGLGLTELGRFATEYRALFGETPSATFGGSHHEHLGQARGIPPLTGVNDAPLPAEHSVRLSAASGS
jgi:AraC family ethanolamine operon transcriptional activator